MTVSDHQAQTVARDRRRRMTESVQRWARATGRDDTQPSPDSWLCSRWGTVARQRTPVMEERRPGDATLLLWALLVESGLTVDVGRLKCPVCDSGRIVERFSGRRAVANKRELFAAGWTVVQESGDHVWLRLERDCGQCKGTGKAGRDTREAARLVLEVSQDLEHEGDAGTHSPEDWPRVRERRDHLSVLADRLQPDLAGVREPNPEHEALGEWLAQWLAGRDEWVEAGIAALDRVTPPSRLDARFGVSVGGKFHEFDAGHHVTAVEAIPLLNAQAQAEAVPVVFSRGEVDSIIATVIDDTRGAVSVAVPPPRYEAEGRPTSPPIGQHLARRLSRRGRP